MSERRGICPCCKKDLSLRQINRHMRNQRLATAPDEMEIDGVADAGGGDGAMVDERSEEHSGGGEDDGTDDDRMADGVDSGGGRSPLNDEEAHAGSHDQEQADNRDNSPEFHPDRASDSPGSDFADEDVDPALWGIPDWKEDVPSVVTARDVHESGVDDDSAPFNHAQLEEERWSEDEPLDNVGADGAESEEDDEFVNAALQRQLQDVYEEGLDETELDNVMAFALKLGSNISRQTFNALRIAFAPKLQIRSEYRLYKLIDDLSSLMPVIYDCCINSCCIYVDLFSQLEACPYCKAVRYKTSIRTNRQTPRQTFHYIPLIPRLQAYFRNPDQMDDLTYRATYDEKVREEDLIRDIFDCTHYRTLLETDVVVDGETLPHRFFSDHRDIALGFSGDGIQIFRKRGTGSPTTTPIILLNYNLPPTIRTHLRNVLPIGNIPGPKAPKDINSFLWPLKQELDKLAKGVKTYDCQEDDNFDHHAYVLNGSGDIPWMTHITGTKGQNGIAPCRTCDIQGVRNKDLNSTPYYVPLMHPLDHQDVEDRGKTWDPAALPLRTHDSFRERIAHIESLPTKKARAEASKAWGINETSILYSLSSFDFSRSFPWEFMHLLFENVIPNLIYLWKGKFKDIARGEWVMPDGVWEAIGKETAACSNTIPSSFVGKLPNIATDQGLYKAEFYSFWFIYLMPILLHGRLQQQYYIHACALANIIKLCLSFEMPRSDVPKIRAGLIQWVLDFEKLYYQYTQENLSVCTLTIHGLLHLADDIGGTAPIWVTWSFLIERFAGSLLPAIKNRTNPWGVLAMRFKRAAQLNHIRILYRLEAKLDFKGRLKDEISRNEGAFDEYPDNTLRYPCRKNFSPPANVLNKVIAYFITYGQHVDRKGKLQQPSVAAVRHALPATMQKWGKMRIKRGDLIRGSHGVAFDDSWERDSSFVRYVQHLDKNVNRPNKIPEFKKEVQYGQFHFTLVIPMAKSKTLRITEDRIFLLAYITPCDTSKGSAWPDATKEVVTYQKLSPQVAVDLGTVECVVGRVQFGTARKQWGFIDRSGDGARATFAEPDELEDSEDEGED